MVVKSDKEFDPELSENSDMMLLAKDLIDYIVFRNCISYEWEPIEFRGDQIYNASVPTLRRALHFLDYILECEIDELFSAMKKGNFLNSEGYERFAKTLAAKYFPEGFDAKYFLFYCVTLSLIAAYFYSHKIFDAPDLAKMHMCQFLQGCDVSAGGWDDTCKIAEKLVKMLRDSLNEITPTDIGVFSDEIEHRDREQEEVSDESNYSLSEEESVFSRREESSFEQQKERTCSKIKRYVKLYAQCSSTCTLEVGICSLRGPESSADKSPKCVFEEKNAVNVLESDNKQRPGTSNDDYEVVHIICDFKMRMHLLWNEINSW